MDPFEVYAYWDLWRTSPNLTLTLTPLAQCFPSAISAIILKISFLLATYRRNPWQALMETFGSTESRLKNTGCYTNVCTVTDVHVGRYSAESLQSSTIFRFNHLSRDFSAHPELRSPLRSKFRRWSPNLLPLFTMFLRLQQLFRLGFLLQRQKQPPKLLTPKLWVCTPHSRSPPLSLFLWSLSSLFRPHSPPLEARVRGVTPGKVFENLRCFEF